MWDAAFQTRLEIVNENKHSLWVVAHYLSLYISAVRFGTTRGSVVIHPT